MRKFSLFLPLIMLTACNWIITHPTEDAEAVGLVEQGVQEIYSYERKTLSPTPPQPNVAPPFKQEVQ